MSEIDKNKPQEDIINDTFDDDDLWQNQSSELGSPPELELPESTNLEDIKDINNENEQSETKTINGSVSKNDLENNQEIDESKSSKISYLKNDDVITQNLPLTENNQKLEKLNNSSLVKNSSDQSLPDDFNKIASEIEDSLLEENVSEIEEGDEIVENVPINDDDEVNDLIAQKNLLIHEIQHLLQQKDELIRGQKEVNENISLLVKEGLKELENKKQNLEVVIQKLERRKERIENEMKTTFSGVSQDLAIKVQGFKDYLVGSLQDLAIAAEQLDLNTGKAEPWETSQKPIIDSPAKNTIPQFVEKSFQEETRIIRSLLDQYRTKPDYYGPSWQLRRTFEPIHAQRVSDWFFTQGGRGALKSMTSRLQNILVTSAIISILSHLYGDRTRVLILSDTPEKLGEWRRGLQDCLGISRSDFGPSRGVVLFETPEALCQKAERIMDDKDLPFVIMDQNENRVSLSLLQFPLWLAFAPEKSTSSYDYF